MEYCSTLGIPFDVRLTASTWGNSDLLTCVVLNNVLTVCLVVFFFYLKIQGNWGQQLICVCHSRFNQGGHKTDWAGKHIVWNSIVDNIQHQVNSPKSIVFVTHILQLQQQLWVDSMMLNSCWHFVLKSTYTHTYICTYTNVHTQWNTGFVYHPLGCCVESILCEW